MAKRSQVEEFYNQVYDAEWERGWELGKYWVERKMRDYDEMNNTQKRELVQDLREQNHWFDFEPKGRKKKRDRLI
jgi:hypothetical protein